MTTREMREATIVILPEDDHDPIRYIERTRNYYLAIGFDNPYRWAHHAEVPFTPLAKPLNESRIGIVTTAAPFQPDLPDQGPGAPYNGAAKFQTVYSATTGVQPDLRISHVGYDRIHTTAEDMRTWFPMERLREAEEAGRIGSIGPRFAGAPTTRSQRHTTELDAPKILEMFKEDEIDAAVLVPN
jgi:Glycine/sarcosine/betaine reductase selenoprotein B (GRDB)